VNPGIRRTRYIHRATTILQCDETDSELSIQEISKLLSNLQAYNAWKKRNK